MGADIHLYVERLVDGRWTICRGDYEPSRNYDLFAILASVRNGRGFAGVKTGEGFVPIAMPRGVPGDASPEYMADVGDWVHDGHSHSWHTVAELMAYDWTQKTTKNGIVDPAQLARWKLTGSPDMYCGGIGGPGIHVYTQEDAVSAAEACSLDWWELYHGRRESPTVAAFLGQFLVERPHFMVEWGVEYAQQATEFLTSTMPRLWRLGRPDEVRIVFFFDN